MTEPVTEAIRIGVDIVEACAARQPILPLLARYRAAIEREAAAQAEARVRELGEVLLRLFDRLDDRPHLREAIRAALATEVSDE